MFHNYINHVSLIVDTSGSMQGQPVVKVFDTALDRLKTRSVELNQETRISIYTFASKVECLVFDMDVMRFKTLAGYWNAAGQTALIDAVIKSSQDNEKLPQLYNDHAFLQYVITDGAENYSHGTANQLKNLIQGLPDNWTMACLVPDATGSHEAKKFGFPADSIAIWDTQSKHGLEDVGKQFVATVDNYMAMRATGVRGTSGLFKLDSSGLSKAAVKSALQEVLASQVEILTVRKEMPIKEYVESWLGKGSYRLGSAYYQPTKRVKVQDYKNILIQDVKNGRVYEGHNMRQLLGLPDATIDIDPGQHKDWRIFVQSTSVNRKLYPNTFLLVRK